MNGGVGDRPSFVPSEGISEILPKEAPKLGDGISAISFAGNDHVIQSMQLPPEGGTQVQTPVTDVAKAINKSSHHLIQSGGASLSGKVIPKQNPVVVLKNPLVAPGVPETVLEARVEGVAGQVLSDKEKILEEGTQKLRSALQSLRAFDPSKPLNPARANIEDRMNQLCVPGVGIAVIYKGVVIPLGFGQLENTKLLSQAASDSKTITALTVLALVDEGLLKLDDDVGEILGSDLWARIDTEKHTIDELDEEGQVVGEKKPKVTILNLLSHTAETNIGGFGGYEKEGERKIPTTVDEILEDVRLLSAPDIQRHEYSGGGYEVLRKIIELKVGNFEDTVKARVLDKLGMKESTYHPKGGDATACGNDPNGRPLPGGSFVYPQLAAAGLWTTPEELAQVVLGIQYAHGQDGGIVSKATASEMLASRTDGKPNGLGVFVEEMKGSKVFFHPGGNAGFQNIMVGNDKGQGVVIMTNADYGGHPLWKEVLAAVAKEFEWPDHENLKLCQPLFEPSEAFTQSELASLNPSEWAAGYVGSYFSEDRGEKHTAAIIEEGGKIFVQEDDNPRMEVTALGPKLGGFREFIPGPYDMLRFTGDSNTGHLTLELYGKKWQR